MFRFTLFILFFSCTAMLHAQHGSVKLVDAGSGWASNSVNTVIFRKNSLVTFNGNQYISFYDAEKYLVLGKRKHGDTNWQIRRTIYKGK
ncbi:MAG: neuraminidase, partial [Chitinophagaceae bacterium]|nr:neuraminidase [Chitinophagaceae bacterium]